MNVANPGIMQISRVEINFAMLAFSTNHKPHKCALSILKDQLIYMKVPLDTVGEVAKNVKGTTTMAAHNVPGLNE
jgi:hypothetical protein